MYTKSRSRFLNFLVTICACNNLNIKVHFQSRDGTGFIHMAFLSDEYYLCYENWKRNLQLKVKQRK